MGFVIGSVAAGILVGSLGGLVGIGGGVVLVPLLLYVYGLGMHLAAGTSLSIVLPLSLAGAISHFQRGNVDLRLTLLIGIGGIIGSVLGSWAGSHLPGTVLKKIFAMILLLIALNTLADAYGINVPGLRRAAAAGSPAAAERTVTGPQEAGTPREGVALSEGMPSEGEGSPHGERRVR